MTTTTMTYALAINPLEQCLKSVDRLGMGYIFPGDRRKVPSKTGAARLVGKVRPDAHSRRRLSVSSGAVAVCKVELGWPGE